MKTNSYIILRNESIKNHTSIKVGGIVKCLIIPYDRDSLIKLIKKCIKKELPYYVIGNGTNLLVSEYYHDKYFIKNTLALSNISIHGNYVYAGSSISLKKLVAFCAKNNLYCMEFLYCIPGTLGGAIYMNAGRGAVHDKTISKYIEKVEVFDGKRTFFLNNEKCNFKHRNSIFQKRKYIILSCVLKLPRQNMQEGINLIRERKKYVINTQDLEYPSAGTVFKNNFSFMKNLKGVRIGGAQFSLKNSSFIINRNNASFQDVFKLIEYAQEYCRLHEFPVPELELCIIE